MPQVTGVDAGWTEGQTYRQIELNTSRHQTANMPKVEGDKNVGAINELY